jgi:hypothetical protein
MTDICAALGVSQRLLHDCSKAHLAMSPSRYRRRRAMQDAHCALRGADPAARLVTEHGGTSRRAGPALNFCDAVDCPNQPAINRRRSAALSSNPPAEPPMHQARCAGFSTRPGPNLVQGRGEILPSSRPKGSATRIRSPRTIRTRVARRTVASRSGWRGLAPDPARASSRKAAKSAHPGSAAHPCYRRMNR